MIRVKGPYSNQTLILQHPLELPEGTEVEVEVQPLNDAAEGGWTELGVGRLEDEWDNPQDAVYDDWRKIYGVQRL